MWSVLGFLILLNEINHCSLLQLMWSSTWSAKGKNHGRWCLGMLFPFIQKSLHESMYFHVYFRYQNLMEKQTKKGCSQSEWKKTTGRRMKTWLFNGGSNTTQLQHVHWMLPGSWVSIALSSCCLPSHTLVRTFLHSSCFRTKVYFIVYQITLIMSDVMTCQRLWVTATAAVLGNGADTSGTAHLRPNVSYSISNVATQLLPLFF